MPSPIHPLRRALEILSGALCASALFAIMALTFFDVIGRKFVGHSIPGAFEMTELLMVVVIFAAIPLVSLRGEHVVFDSLDSRLSPATRRTQHLMVHAFCGAVFLGLAYLMWKFGLNMAQSGETTSQLKVPKAPFVYGMGLFALLTGLVHLALARQTPVESEDVSVL